MSNPKTFQASLIAGTVALAFSSLLSIAQVVNPGVQVSGNPANNDCAKFVVSGGNVQSITTAGSGCAGSSVTPANPTATAGPNAVNGSATNYMRSDAAPAVQLGSAAQPGIVQPDGTTITASAGVISAVQQTLPAGANPSATAGPAAVNGSASTFMRSDGAPAVQQGSAAQKGIVEVDGSTITASAGVISAVQPAGANPSATAGPAAVNGSASTFMRSDGAPAVQKGLSTQFGIVEVDNSTITSSAGVISAVQPAGANPSATAGPAAVNGSATTFMRSDGAPAVQKGSASQFGITECDGTTITCVSGIDTLNLGNANTWTASQTINGGNLTIANTSNAIFNQKFYGGTAANSAMVINTTNNASPSGDVFYFNGDIQIFETPAAAIKLDYNSTNANSWTMAAHLYLSSLPTTNPGGTVSALCVGSTLGGVWTDTSGTICGISALRFKNLNAVLVQSDMLKGILSLRTQAWHYKDEFADHGLREHVGLIADDLAKMDWRCADRDDDGSLENYSDRCLETYLVGAIKELQAEILVLKQQK